MARIVARGMRHAGVLAAVVMTMAGGEDSHCTAQVVPPPEATPVELVVSGRTSTLRSITVEAVGQSIPETFSGDKLKNAEGFAWYVSRHYALQTDYDAGKARHLLTMLELAYPHYVELFGREIPGIERMRMAVIYGSSTASLTRALGADGIEWNFGGGGITYEGFNAAFNYPSGSLQYHQHYIMLHECAHLYQMCLNGTVMNTPYWYYEGVADAVAHHVWEESAQRLTMAVMDKPTVNNWYDDGMERLKKSPFTAGDILAGRVVGRDVGFLLVNYFCTDARRVMRWRIWRDEVSGLPSGAGAAKESARLMEELFGSAALDADFAAWLGARRSTFHYVDWGWEQDGDAMISYGWPQTGAYSQTDLRMPPGELAAHDPLVMDYPLHAASPLVDRVERGGQTPTVGCVVGFALNPDAGVAGMGLGVRERSLVKVLVEQRRRLVVDGTDVGAGKVSVELGEDVRAASAASQEIGVTVRIERDGLRVIARGGEGAGAREVSAWLALDATQRERVLKGSMAVLSRDGRHRITPLVDDGRRAEPDLGAAAPGNRWRFGMDRELLALERAAWRLGAGAPASLTALKERVAGLVGQDAATVERARTAYAGDVERVREDVRGCGAGAERVVLALGELGG